MGLRRDHLAFAGRIAAVVLLLFAGAERGMAQQASGEELRGVAVWVQDGDTLDLADRLGRVFTVRLHGIDAPEFDQTCLVRRREVPCGEDAAARLEAMVLNRPLVCLVQGVTWGRIAARCLLDGQDIAATLVREGHAIAYRRFSTLYVAEEEEARQARRGIWRGNMESPSCYRRPRAAGCPCPIQRCIQ
jgi:endonuclease YncB( thermonuclease family)